MNPEFGRFLHFDPSFHSWLHTTYMASNPMQIVSLCYVFVYCMYFKSTKALSIEKLSLFYGSKSEMTCPIVVEFEFLFYFLPEDHAIGLSTFTVMAGLGGNYLFYFTIVMT